MSDVLEINVPTGQHVERDFTPEELAERQAMILELQQACQEAEAKREKALEKLAALGLTRDDLTALGL